MGWALSSPQYCLTRRQWFGSALTALPLAGVLRAQQEPTYSADVKVVNVLATVRNKRNEIVRTLTKDDFTLEEDGRRQTIRYFAQQAELPLTLGLLVDTSMSQARVLEPERRASVRFFQQVLRPEKDVAFVIHFDTEVELLQDITSVRKDLEAALDNLSTPARGGGRRGRGQGPGGPSPGQRGVGTALYDAVYLGADDMMKKQTGRKALILLSDGVDFGSKISLNTAIEWAQRTDTLVYSIRFFDEDRRGGGRVLGGAIGFPGGRRGGRGGRPPAAAQENGKKVLERLAKETGGSYFEVSDKQPIEKTFSLIEEELRNQYSLGYTSDATTSGFRKIKLSVKQKDLVVTTRDGYYSNK